MRWSAVAFLSILPWTALAQAPVVAVFDVEKKGVQLTKQASAGISDFLAASLMASGSYQVVPRSEIEKALTAKKADSYRACYDDSCRIEIGRELAAQKTLATQIARLGKMCVVTLQIYDLRLQTSERAGVGRGDCTEEALFRSVETAMQAMMQGRSTASRAQPAPVGDDLDAQLARVKQGKEDAAAKRKAQLERWPKLVAHAETREIPSEKRIEALEKHLAEAPDDADERWSAEDLLRRVSERYSSRRLPNGVVVMVDEASGRPSATLMFHGGVRNQDPEEGESGAALLWRELYAGSRSPLLDTGGDHKQFGVVRTEAQQFMLLDLSRNGMDKAAGKLLAFFQSFPLDEQSLAAARKGLLAESNWCGYQEAEQLECVVDVTQAELTRTPGYSVEVRANPARRASIEALTVAKLKAFKQSAYPPGLAVLAVEGAPAEAVYKEVEPIAATWKSEGYHLRVQQPLEQGFGKVIRAPAGASHLVAAMYGPPADQLEDVYAFDVLAAVLQARLQKAAGSRSDAGYRHSSEPGMLWARMPLKAIAPGVKTLKTSLSGMHKVTVAEIKAAATKLATQRGETHNLRNDAERYLIGLPLRFSETYGKRITRVTADDVARVAKQYLFDKPLLLAAVVPPAAPAPKEEALTQEATKFWRR